MQKKICANKFSAQLNGVSISSVYLTLNEYIGFCILTSPGILRSSQKITQTDLPCRSCQPHRKPCQLVQYLYVGVKRHTVCLPHFLETSVPKQQSEWRSNVQ